MRKTVGHFQRAQTPPKDLLRKRPFSGKNASFDTLRKNCAPSIVSSGSWSCENTLGGALTRRDFGEVAAFGHFAEFGRLFLPEALLMRMSDRFKCFASRTEA